MSFLINDALADAAVGSSATNGMMSVLPMIVMLFLFMYFMIIRPQSKKAKQHKDLIINLQPGDEIITIGGVMGKIEEISDNLIKLQIATATVITIQKNAIASVLPKGTMKSGK
jgi:preprotein translocase, YajC subunit